MHFSTSLRYPLPRVVIAEQYRRILKFSARNDVHLLPCNEASKDAVILSHFGIGQRQI